MRTRRPVVLIVWIMTVLLGIGLNLAAAQGGYNDDRVMIQGFMWESHQEGKQTGAGGTQYEVNWRNKWYDFVKGKAQELADAKFDLIWLPPPSEGEGAGYHPRELYKFDNNYGSEAQQRDMIKALLAVGIEPIADVVINHRTGVGSWATFKNPDWPSNYICEDDEFWFHDLSDLNEADQAIRKKNQRGAPDYTGSDFPKWEGSRDLDHTNSNLRQDIKTYLGKLKALGYRGWRYDMVKGYAPEYVAEYDYATSPTFAVGEYRDEEAKKLTAWVDGTKMQGQPDPAQKACSAFDFATFALLRRFINDGMYNHLPAITWHDDVYDGLIAINRDKAATFIENHDTGFPQNQFDSFWNNEKLMQAYAFILTHPGVPCVYWKHFFDWNHGKEIAALVKARKYAGINSGSYIKTQVYGNDYVAEVGDKPTESSTLLVKIGPGMEFNPDPAVWGLETSGNGYAVWVRKTKKAETQESVDKPKPGLSSPTDQ